MSLQEKIEAAFLKTRDRYPQVNEYSFDLGYEAAIEDIKKNGPFVSQWKLRRDGFIQYVNSPMDPKEFPDWDVVPLYRLEEISK